MSKNVTIIYVGIVDDAVRSGLHIYPLFQPTGSYIDSHPYDGTVYDTNVKGFGELGGLDPMGSTTTKFAAYELAYRAAEEAIKAGTENVGITFPIATFEDEIYWIQIGRNMEDQGFHTTIAEANEAEADNGEE